MAHTGQTQCDLVTLTFNLGGHGACRWCGYTSSICTPTGKFLGLIPFGRYGTFYVFALLGLWPWPLTFWLQTGAQYSTCHGVPSCQFWWYYDYSFSIYGPLGQHGSDWSRDLVTLIFDLGFHGACGWCGSLLSIHTPSLKFVGMPMLLAFGRYAARCVSALMGLVTLIFDPLILKLVCESHLRWGTFLPNLGTLGLWILELFAMYATDGQTDGQRQRLLSPSLRAGA